LEAIVTDLYKISKAQADYVSKAVACLAAHIGVEPATFSVVDHTSAIRAAFELHDDGKKPAGEPAGFALRSGPCGRSLR
jgi:hypothetical protein